MSHTGNRLQRNITRRSLASNDIPPKKIDVTPQEITKGGVLDGHQLIGEFRGNGSTVLIGLSTSESLDINNVLNDNEKGVIIGYTPSSVHFQLFRNDGLGSKVTTVLDNRLKDTEIHTFDITLKGDGRLLIRFDGAEDTITTKIPSISDTLYIVNYGVY